MAWNLDSDRPIYAQIIEHIRMDIISGKYKPGDRLPAVRELALVAAVNPNTMQKALADLEDLGLVFTRRTSGRFVTTDTEVIKKNRELVVRNSLETLIESLRRLGYTKEELIELVTRFVKEA
ncbi:MAG: GntR family transcriptional regulator [Lachnospiraceae bacterium]|nr:GntR family transcriptional regulator [Lachnospiraceae bacterium]MDY5742444.1 GntR family transcriptional regulator [Lachnospiraceae bacterium]